MIGHVRGDIDGAHHLGGGVAVRIANVINHAVTAGLAGVHIIRDRDTASSDNAGVIGNSRAGIDIAVAKHDVNRTIAKQGYYRRGDVRCDVHGAYQRRCRIAGRIGNVVDYAVTANGADVNCTGDDKAVAKIAINVIVRGRTGIDVHVAQFAIDGRESLQHEHRRRLIGHCHCHGRLRAAAIVRTVDRVEGHRRRSRREYLRRIVGQR